MELWMPTMSRNCREKMVKPVMPMNRYDQISVHTELVGASPDTAIALARRGLSDGSLIEQANFLTVYGCFFDEVIPLLDAWIAVAHRRSSVFVLAPAKCFRGLAGYWAWLLGSRARLLALQGRVPEAVQTWLACGRRFAAHGGLNPAVLARRSGAALAMHRLGRRDEARQLASEEVTLARRWGAPTALGRALRVAAWSQATTTVWHL
jgi:hypothetical protein